MVNEITVAKSSIPALTMDEAELLNVLRNSLYPNVQTDSIKMVLGYCKAAGLDPMHKPVHIVPMWNSAAGRSIDVVMPGIGMYRTQAARSGQYAGVTDPEFGADVTEEIGGVTITYPASCRVTVKRLLNNGSIAEFSATERWKENYAMKGGKEKSVAPNAMWMKRPYGQLAKCAEAQALRKAFPEFGAQPTAEEMDGKAYDETQVVTGEVVNKKLTPEVAVASNVPDDYEQYEADVLPLLKEAANKGYETLSQEFTVLATSPLKKALWTKHGVALKLIAQQTVDAQDE
jgi:phage recombination protein Bet